ncbi:restriction endonuclease subunit S [Crocosphaera chwakensis]|uniref:Type I restriction-modification enzyme, S subunit, putative n=1 Tax=Crocosphaera chwakensis CCY0110 TaxID=391612 RepID=A3IYW0_9CHRO|nr:restriction endonuclease subunit S [Crocosphaera chwakensis]EAZ88335.1 type I restriction-modification enzyme, S subunit, putative [Crocosphaera chwakensis CCY0110]
MDIDAIKSLIVKLGFSREDESNQIYCKKYSDHKNYTISLNFETQWTLQKLGKITEIISGQSPQSKFYNKNQQGLPFYQGKIEFGNMYLKEPKTWTTQITKESIKDDILMSVRAPVGSLNINRFDKICIGRGLAAIRSKAENVFIKYIYYFLLFNPELIVGTEGLIFSSISRDQISKISIPLPPKEVQEQII